MSFFDLRGASGRQRIPTSGALAPLPQYQGINADALKDEMP